MKNSKEIIMKHLEKWLEYTIKQNQETVVAMIENGDEDSISYVEGFIDGLKNTLLHIKKTQQIKNKKESKMTINGKKVIGKIFAYDGCHKIYICETKKDIQEAKELGFDMYEIKDIEQKYNEGCELRFIKNWSLTKCFVGQFENAIFKYKN